MKRGICDKKIEDWNWNLNWKALFYGQIILHVSYILEKRVVTQQNI